MNMQLATAVRSEDTDTALRVASVIPVFVDGTGRRRRLVILLGWLVAVACVAYLGIIGISMSGTKVGPLPEVPDVASKSVVFGSEVDALPQGVLESSVPVLAVVPQPEAPQTEALAAPTFSHAKEVVPAAKKVVPAAKEVVPAAKKVVPAAKKVVTAKTPSAASSSKSTVGMKGAVQ
jgi:hypothetical protein